jgi:hypothetical protein
MVTGATTGRGDAGSGAGEPARIIVFDTTLRDGEQSPGATLTAEEKLEVADALVALGVDVMEAGFPAASPGDFEAVRAIAARVKGATVAGLARCNGPTSSGRRTPYAAPSRRGSTPSSPPPISIFSTSCG